MCLGAIEGFFGVGEVGEVGEVGIGATVKADAVEETVVDTVDIAVRVVIVYGRYRVDV